MFNCDYHIHTRLSPCAARDFDLEKIIKVQQERGVKEIGITDHDYAYGYKAKNIEAVRKIVQKCESPIPIHFGVRITHLGIPSGLHQHPAGIIL